MPTGPLGNAEAARRSAPRSRFAALAGLLFAFVVLGALPPSGLAGLLQGNAADEERLARSTAALRSTVDRTVARVSEAVAPVVAPVKQVAKPTQAPAAVAQRADDPQTQPPLHGTNPHGQGTVAGVDLTPRADRPTGGNPTGEDSGEEIVVGRARGERGADGAYHGHITIVALFGNEVVGVDTKPGETKAGPLDPIQTGLLDAICNGSGNQVCVSAVRADSATTPSGSTNRYSTAHATLGGAGGLDVGAAESNGNISSDAQCQSSHGDSSVASVNAGGTAVATAAQSRTDSKACKGQAPQQTNQSSVLGLGGTGVPIPAPGCANGTPDTVTGIPTLLPIVCNADDNGQQAPAPVGVRDALTVYTLATGTMALQRTATAASESHAVAPPAQCADGIDNDGDGVVDGADGGCHTDGNPNNPGSYNPADDDESGGGAPPPPPPDTGDESGRPACSDGRDNDGDGKVDAADPGCHSDGDANNPDSYDPDDRSEGGGPACSDSRDNDGDGRVDARDPGCHSDGDANNPDSYEPGDRSEADGAQCSDGRDNDGDGRVDARDPGCHSDGNADNPDSYVPGDDSELDEARKALSSLPLTGADVLALALAGLVMLAGGLALRRRFGDA